jgi:hypothetical protein
MLRPNTDVLTYKQTALLEEIKSDGQSVNFDLLSDSNRLTAEQLKQKGWLLPILGRYIDRVYVPSSMHEVYDGASWLRF